MWLTPFLFQVLRHRERPQAAGEALDGLRSAEAAGFGERVTACMRALRRARCDDRQRRRSPRARTTVPAFPSMGLLGAAVFNRRFESWVASGPL